MKKEQPKPKAKAPAKKPADAPHVGHVPPAARDMLWMLDQVFNDVSNLIGKVQDELPTELELTGPQRRRLISARVRKWGFITKAWEVVDARPNYAPPNFSKPDMAAMMANAEKTRQTLTLVSQLQRLLDDYLLTCNDSLYRDALRIYAALQEQSNARIPGADDIFQILRQFFMLRRRNLNQAEPTEKELDHKLHQLLHGTADGEMIIKNESPHMVGGEREVVADVQKRGRRKAEVKVKEEE